MNTSSIDRAQSALKNSVIFCQLMAEARTAGVSGWWDGSAFRSHPVGIIDSTIKMTNHWHCDSYCDIYITDGDGWDRNVCKDPAAHGNPHPKPINGDIVKVWSNGKWIGEDFEGIIGERVLEILVRAAAQIEAYNDAKARRDAEQKLKEAAARTALVDAALQKAVIS